MTTKRPLDIHDEAVLAPVKILYIEYQLRQPPKKPIILSQLKPDVEITIFDDVYHLHSSNITKASPFFKTSLSARWWKPRNTHRGPDGIKYKYSLVLDTHELDSNMGILEPVYSGARQDHLETDNFAEGDEAYMPLDAFQKRVRARVATMPFYFFEILARRELIRGLPHPDRLSAIIEELERFLEGMLTMKKAYALLFRIWQGDTLTRTEGSILNIVFKTADIAKMYSSLPPIAYTLEIMVVFELSIKRPPEDVDIVALVLFAIDIRSKDLYNDAFVVFVNKLFMMFGFDTDLGHHRLPNKVKHKAIMELARISNIRREVVISEVFTLEDFDGRKIWPSGTSGSLSLDNPTSEYRYRVLRDIENTISGIRRTFYIDIYDQLGNNLRVPCSELNDGDYPWE